ncbi:glycosyltransferase [Pontibacter ruber]|uniref:Nucleotide disphospho-sugar-binding domain-containing protein n=1 Tax=Pontibacter ruber TaxID=1343895 RepID=A0ABW5D1K7_9BACT|nr:glycosyltransferase [Pontibacter ruber]
MKIALTTLGSLGDVNPMLGLALELRDRGHEVSLSTSRYFRPHIEKHSIRFHEVLPNLDPNNKEIIHTVLDPKRGPERFHREIIFPDVEKSYRTFLEVAQDADLIISGILSYFAPLCAKKLNKPWAAVMLSPMTFWSIYDPPVIPTMEFIKYAYRVGPDFNRFLFREIFRVSNEWTKQVQELRRQESIDDQSNPLTDGATSEYLNIGLYSPLLGSVQQDFPPNSRLTGFVFFDHNLTHQELSPGLKHFLESGEPPVVFTLGSNSVMKHSSLFDLFYEVAQKLNSRSVILTGASNFRKYKRLSNDKIFFDDYAPYSGLFPYASCVVHQGGIGTTGQAMRSGTPMLILPECNDQHDNLERTKRLGIATGIPMKRVNRYRLRKAIEKLLTVSNYKDKAAQVGNAIQRENGLKDAADEVEKLLHRTQANSQQRIRY